MQSLTPHTAISYNGLFITSTTGTITITAGKVFSCTGTLTLSGTDGSTLNIGTGGTLGTGAFLNVGTGANQIDLTSGKVNVGKINSTAVIGTGISSDLWRA